MAISIIVVGAGPAAAAFCQRLYESGHKVTVMIEGDLSPVSYPDRIAKIDQASEIWKLSNTQDGVTVTLDQYQNFNHVSIHGAGGLSSRWGGGMAKLNHADMNINKKVASEIDQYYDFAHSMIGTNDNSGDPLADYIGLFRSSQTRHSKQDDVTRFKQSTGNVLFGQSVQAITHASHPQTATKACNLCGHCSIFCGRGSFYNAQQSFQNLQKFHKIIDNTKVNNVRKTGAGYEIDAISDGEVISVKADVVVMAAGPVNTYEILTQTIFADLGQPVSLLNTPVIRGMAFSPFYRMKKRTTVANMMASIEYKAHEKAVVSFVNGADIPVSDWLSFLPVKNKLAARLISIFRKYFVAYMIFFNSDCAQNTLEITADKIQIKGRNTEKFMASSKEAIRHFKRFLLKNRFIDVPFLRAALPPGRDIHYGGSLPMNGEGRAATNADCELVGHQNIYIIDGSWLPRMSEKFHTLTLMANAARIADRLSSRMKRTS